MFGLEDKYMYTSLHALDLRAAYCWQ